MSNSAPGRARKGPRRVVNFVLKCLLWLSVVAMGLLAFLWPFAVSADPAQPAFKPLAIATLCAFLAVIAALLARRVRR